MIESARYVKLIDEINNKEYNSKDNWGLYIQNYDCIGEPIQQTTYVDIPGGKRLDLSEALVGHPVFTSRKIKIVLSGNARSKNDWIKIMSSIRSNVHGRKCKIIFSDDVDSYYVGRVTVRDFDSELSIGTFTIDVEAEPFRYASVETEYRFLAGGTHGTYTLVVPSNGLDVSPQFQTTMSGAPDSATMNLKIGSKTYHLPKGRYSDPLIKVNGFKEVEMKFSGSYGGVISMTFLGGGL